MAQGDDDKKYGILPDAFEEELNAFAKRYDELMAQPGMTRTEAISEIRKEQTLEFSEMRRQEQLGAQRSSQEPQQHTGPARGNVPLDRSNTPTPQGVDVEAGREPQGQGREAAPQLELVTDNRAPTTAKQELAEYEARAAGQRREPGLAAGPEIDGSKAAHNDLKKENSTARAELADFEKGGAGRSDASSGPDRKPPDPNDIER